MGGVSLDVVWPRGEGKLDKGDEWGSLFEHLLPEVRGMALAPALHLRL